MHIPPPSPKKTLQLILQMIQSDTKVVQRISKGRESRWNALSKENSDKLIKYGTFLSEILKKDEKEKDSAKKAYQNLNVEELVELYNNETKKDKK
jgi:glycine betaine/choline ABC-type transport system substrate-binding protein